MRGIGQVKGPDRAALGAGNLPRKPLPGNRDSPGGIYPSLERGALPFPLPRCCSHSSLPAPWGCPFPPHPGLGLLPESAWVQVGVAGLERAAAPLSGLRA